MVAAKTIKVVVLIPPAVPTGEPPTNIRINVKIEEAFVKFSCGKVEKPEALVFAD